MADESPPEVRADLFELDHLFGCWIRALPDLEEYVEETGEDVPPEELHGWIFLDDSTMVELRFEEAETEDEAEDEDDVGHLTVAGFYSYRLDDGGQLVAAPRYAGDDDDGSTRYSPVDVETLVEWGFDDEVIDQVVDAARSQGMTFIETFNEEDAERVKAQYWDKVERRER